MEMEKMEKGKGNGKMEMEKWKWKNGNRKMEKAKGKERGCHPKGLHFHFCPNLVQLYKKLNLPRQESTHLMWTQRCQQGKQ